MLKTFYPPEYFNVRYNHYHAITIKLVNDIQEPLRFRAGSVVLKLLFLNGEKQDINSSY